MVLKGKNHGSWKGGRISTGKLGYIRAYMPGHPRAINNHVYEHILVWEQTHNKLLPEGWMVHHLNGIRNDNRPRNLLAMPKGKHHGQLVNQALKQRIRELEQEVKLLERALDNNQSIFRIEEN